MTDNVPFAEAASEAARKVVTHTECSFAEAQMAIIAASQVAATERLAVAVEDGLLNLLAVLREGNEWSERQYVARREERL